MPGAKTPGKFTRSNARDAPGKWLWKRWDPIIIRHGFIILFFLPLFTQINQNIITFPKKNLNLKISRCGRERVRERQREEEGRRIRR